LKYIPVVVNEEVQNPICQYRSICDVNNTFKISLLYIPLELRENEKRRYIYLIMFYDEKNNSLKKLND